MAKEVAISGMVGLTLGTLVAPVFALLVPTMQPGRLASGEGAGISLKTEITPL